MLKISPVPVFNDNYIWVLHTPTHALVVDPGDAGPICAWLAAQRLALAGVVLTHGHPDHVGGLAGLLAVHPAPVYGPGELAGVDHPVDEGDQIAPPGWPEALTVWATPGHTRHHLSYVLPGAVFCGDTLFACGCGRIFDGTPAQLYASLTRLASLPDDTLVYCSHEYTLSNQQFAGQIEPDNAALSARRQRDQARRAAGLPTVPGTMAEERQTNPFLRVDQPAVRQALARQNGKPADTSLQAFTALREWKNRF